MSPDLPCPRCTGNLVTDTLGEADLICMLCSRRWNLVEQHLEPAQLSLDALGPIAVKGGQHRRLRRA